MSVVRGSGVKVGLTGLVAWLLWPNVFWPHGHTWQFWGPCTTRQKPNDSQCSHCIATWTVAPNLLPTLVTQLSVGSASRFTWVISPSLPLLHHLFFGSTCLPSSPIPLQFIAHTAPKPFSKTLNPSLKCLAPNPQWPFIRWGCRGTRALLAVVSWVLFRKCNSWNPLECPSHHILWRKTYSTFETQRELIWSLSRAFYQAELKS